MNYFFRVIIHGNILNIIIYLQIFKKTENDITPRNDLFEESCHNVRGLLTFRTSKS